MMMNGWMKKANVLRLSQLLEQCREFNVKLIACEMTMKVLGIKREELIKIGQLRVAFAGSGVDVNSGQVLSLESDVQNQAKFEIGMAKATGQMRSTAALIKGAGNALYLGGGGLIDIARRG